MTTCKSGGDDMDVEQRLRSAGERWRAEQATQRFDLDPQRLSLSTKRRRVSAWASPLGAAAAVLLLAGVVVAGRAGVFESNDGAAPTGQNSASNRSWRPAKPPRCAANKILPSVGRVVTKGGRQYTQIVLKNVDSTACVLDSVLQLLGTSTTGKVTPLRFPEDSRSAFPGTNGTSIIAPGAAGDFWVTTDRTCTQATRNFVGLRLEFGPNDWVEMSFPPQLRHGCLVAESGAGLSGSVNP